MVVFQTKNGVLSGQETWVIQPLVGVRADVLQEAALGLLGYQGAVDSPRDDAITLYWAHAHGGLYIDVPSRGKALFFTYGEGYTFLHLAAYVLRVKEILKTA